jgi:hypothetical protein
VTLRTYAIDNNQNSYDSNYVISYVEADPTTIEPLLAAFLRAWPKSYHPQAPRVVFVADQVDWRTDGPIPISEWTRRLDACQYVCDIPAAEEFRQLALAVENLEPGYRKWLQSLNFRLRTP